MSIDQFIFTGTGSGISEEKNDTMVLKKTLQALVGCGAGSTSLLLLSLFPPFSGLTFACWGLAWSFQILEEHSNADLPLLVLGFRFQAFRFDYHFCSLFLDASERTTLYKQRQQQIWFYRRTNKELWRQERQIESSCRPSPKSLDARWIRRH